MLPRLEETEEEEGMQSPEAAGTRDDGDVQNTTTTAPTRSAGETGEQLKALPTGG